MTRKVVTAAAVVAAAALAVPTAASAEPAPAPAVPHSDVPPFFLPTPDQPLPDYAQIQALASFAPAILGAAAGPTDVAAGPQADLLAQARAFLENAALPDQVKSTLETVITFLDGSGGGGPELPPADGPVIAQFLYPTIGKACISDSADSVGTALAVPGPATLPPPGPAAGQTGFVFTALGTSPIAAVQESPLTATWLNLDNRRSGAVDLTGASNINPGGPATVSAIADTGPGRVLAVVSGSITTQSKEDPAAPARSCGFLPTIGTVYVP
ncbi:hypothetical protein QMK17_02975 [Rhodococcus sp. G-MC3]|uniref:Rv1157c family protein n=1 Tax=Rhodococcus sp. G-MC3 TaxID=3046209 RepID=UPI0024B8F861|nr:hypothetical protein [Rhodococcus sp. G-MC3]MDJ0392295.1 hypothetical protein [Rhodococcus sp. G-MC3]